MNLLREWWRGQTTATTRAAADWPDTDPHAPIQAALSAAEEARSSLLITNRTQALQHSVVNRARDIVCGVVGSLPLTRERDGEDLGPGWLARPDPTRTAAWFQAWVSDDLFFYGVALARVTVRDERGYPIAVEWMPREQVQPDEDGDGFTWWRAPYGDPWGIAWRGGWGADLEPVHVHRRDVIIWESPLLGILNGGCEVLSTANRLDRAANRFADAKVAAGWLSQRAGGEPLDEKDATALVQRFEASRLVNTTAFVNELLDYNESNMDPSRLQLVEGRAYQDAAVARVCNMPNFVVGVGVPNDSMTYKTALTARLDLLDFGLQPFLTCWTQTLTNVTPRGTAVVFDVEAFLRSAQLAATQAAEVAATPAPVPQPA